MDFDVRNHMSVLSEEQAQKARESLMNNKSEVVEEKRITGRVIRRRRKKVKSEDKGVNAASQGEAKVAAEKALESAQPEKDDGKKAVESKAAQQPVEPKSKKVADKKAKPDADVKPSVPKPEPKAEVKEPKAKVVDKPADKEPKAKVVAKPADKEPKAKVVAKPADKEPKAKVVAKPAEKEPKAKVVAKPADKEPKAKVVAKPAEKEPKKAKVAAKPDEKKLAAEKAVKAEVVEESTKPKPKAKAKETIEPKQAKAQDKSKAKESKAVVSGPEPKTSETPAKILEPSKAKVVKPQPKVIETPAKHVEEKAKVAKPVKEVPSQKEEPKAEVVKAAAKEPKAKEKAEDKDKAPKQEKQKAKAGKPGTQEAPKKGKPQDAKKGKAKAAKPGQQPAKGKQGKDAKKANQRGKKIKDTPAKIISLPKVPVAPTAPSGQRRQESGSGRPGSGRPGAGRPGSGRPASGRPGAPRPASGRPGGRPQGAPKGQRPQTPKDVTQTPAPPVDRGGDGRQRPRRKKGKKGGPGIPDDDYLMRKTSSRKREILDRADLYNGKSRSKKRGGGAPKRNKKTEITTPKAIKRRVKVGDTITVGELGKRMGIKAAELVGRLMKLGMMVTLNQSLDVEDATLVANEMGFEVERTSFQEKGILHQVEDKPEDLKSRPPVVTIMGHVDHGKTSLLDTIRAANVTGGEAGGITQHIGAYDVHLENGGHVVFVDTPGHEAFTEMRARGAKVTDLVVLVVAADDGVMDQTREAINHSKAAKVPIMVAVNKIDKPGSEPERVRRELAEMDLVPEDWGGDTIMVDVSAKTGEGVDSLLEMLDLQAEILELKANPDKPASGHVLEARLDKGRGPVATILVQEGTLNAGDAVICGIHHGKIRAMLDDMGRRIDKAGPSIPVEIQGLSGVPEAGDDFQVLENDKTAKQVADHRAMKKRESELSSQTRLSLESFLTKMQEQDVKELNLVVKADVHGSMEALVDALGKLGNEEVKVSVIHAATGAITETDVMLAAASEAIIIGFNVRPTGKVSNVADSENVEIRTYDVIYQIVEDVTAALTGMLAPSYEEEILGRVEVRDTFSVPKIGTVAGCYVTDGKVLRNAQVRLLRDGVVVVKTKISSLRRFKDDAKEVASGFECGIGLDRYNDIKVGDTMEVFDVKEIAGKL